MWTTQIRNIKARGLDGEQTFSAKTLTADQLQELVLSAQKAEWIGNSDLVDFLVACGLSDQDRQRVAKDRFLGFNVGREIWVITLQSLATHVRKTVRVAGISLSVPRVKRYLFVDLVTPGFLTFVKKDMETLDVEGFSRGMLKTFFLEVEEGNKRLSKHERRRFIDRNFASLVPFLLEAIGLDKGLESKMPKEVLSTPAQRFYVALKLAATLEWSQYQDLVYIFNRALQELLFRSNQLGGVNATRDDVDLVTGFPLFPQLVRPDEAIPFEVTLHLLYDMFKNNLGAFSGVEAEALRRCLATARLQVGVALERGNSLDKSQRTLMMFEYFEQEVNKRINLVRKICFVYMTAYADYADRKIAEEVERHKKAMQYLTIPDCYVLVEGPSDEICFSKFFNIMQDEDLIIRVESCGGKADVERRARELRSKEKHVGAIVAILDSDATKQYEDLKRCFTNDRYASVHKLEYGAIEDLFAPSLLCKVANKLFPDGELIIEEIFSSSLDAVKTLERVLFEKKRSKLDKKLFSKELIKNIRDIESIPVEARRIVESSLEVARRRCRELPRVASRPHLASSRRIFLEKLDAKLREVDSEEDEITGSILEEG